MGRSPPTTWGFSEESASLYRYNMEEAGRLLDEAGWVDSDGDGIREKNGEKLTIDWPDNPAWSEAFNELLIGYLANAGFDVQYRTMDDGAAYEEILAGNYTLVTLMELIRVENAEFGIRTHILSPAWRSQLRQIPMAPPR